MLLEFCLLAGCRLGYSFVCFCILFYIHMDIPDFSMIFLTILIANKLVYSFCKQKMAVNLVSFRCWN